MRIRDGVTIYFVRHGQTPWNAQGLAQGSTDIALNDLGRVQARENGARLATLLREIDPKTLEFVSSPLKRACETMEILRAGLGLPASGYATDPRLTEMGFGVCEGTSWPAYAQRLIELERTQAGDPWAFAADGGESYRQLALRALPFFEEAARDTVVACHGGVSRCVQVAMLGIKPSEAIGMFIPQDRIMVLRGSELTWA